MGLYCTLGLLCHTVVVVVYKHHSWVGLVGCFPHLDACMEKYGTVKVNPHGRGIQAPGLLGSMSEGHGVLCNSSLLSISGSKPSAAIIAYNVWGVS